MSDPKKKRGAGFYATVVVVALPLFTAAVMWLTARSRLPLVARLD